MYWHWLIPPQRCPAWVGAIEQVSLVTVSFSLLFLPRRRPTNQSIPLAKGCRP